MEAVIGFFLLIALIFSILIHRTRQQSLEIKKLENVIKTYIRNETKFNDKNNGKEQREGEPGTGEAD